MDMPTGIQGPAAYSIWKTVALSSIAAFVVQLDGSALNVALPAIGRSFGVSLGILQWVVDSYALAYACLLLSAGAASDRFGAHRVFVCGYGIFLAASVLCALSPTSEVLILGRALQGAGGSILVPSSLSLINYACADAPATRTRAIGWWTASGGLAVTAGPVVGGLFVGAVGWRGIFLVNIPVCLAGMVLAAAYRDRREKSASSTGFDLLGQTLAVVAVLGLVGGIIEGGSRGWKPHIVLTGITFFGVFGLLFQRREARSEAPVLPPALFRNTVISSAMFIGFVLSFCALGLVFALSVYFQNVQGYSSVEAGLAFVPFAVTVTIANLIGTAAAARFGSLIAMTSALVVGACGYLLLARMDSGSSYLAMLPAQLLARLGVGAAIPIATSMLLSATSKQQSGIASGGLNAIRQMGAAIGVAAFGALMVGDPSSGFRIAVAICAALLLIAAGSAFLVLRAEKMASRGPQQP